MRTRLRWTARAAGVVALVAGVAACGSGGGGDGVASLGGDDTDSSSSAKQSSTKAKKDPEEAFRAFAQCMREHGIDMPDPQVSTDGKGGTGFSIQAPVGGDAATSGPDDAFKAADEECRKHLEGVVNGREGKGRDADVEKAKQQALDFAKCMRKHGIDFPDPQFEDGGRMIQIGPRESLDPNDPTLRSATEECQKKAGLPQPKAGDGATVFGGEA
jgi:hypothetical protein